MRYPCSTLGRCASLLVSNPCKSAVSAFRVSRARITLFLQGRAGSPLECSMRGRNMPFSAFFFVYQPELFPGKFLGKKNNSSNTLNYVSVIDPTAAHVISKESHPRVSRRRVTCVHSNQLLQSRPLCAGGMQRTHLCHEN